MAEELEALGAAATAGLAAATIEGVRHEAKPSHADSHGACANCHAPLSGPYCVQCGQSAHVHRSLLHMVEELLHGVFHFDTKAWRTIPMLIFRPGQLTRNYIHGQRMRYVSPLALFLFMVFLSFFVASFTNSKSDGQPLSAASLHAQIADYTKQLDAAKAAVAKANADLKDAGKKGESPEDAQERLDDAQQEVEEITQALKVLTDRREPAQPKADQAGKSGADKAKAGNHGSAEAAGEPRNNDAVVKVGPLRVDVSNGAKSDGPVNVNTGKPGDDETSVGVDGDEDASVAHSSDAWVEKMASKMRKKSFLSGSTWFDLALKHSFDNPDLALYKLKNTVYKYSFMLVPISLPFMWLLFFWKRGVKMFDHVVFVLYSLCFMSLLFVVVVLISLLGAGTTVAALAVLVPPIHIFAQLRGAYQLGKFSAWWRTGVLVIVAFIVLVLFFLFVLMMSMH